MIIVACGATFSWAIGMENLPELLVRSLKDYEFTQTQTLIVFNILVAILGMFIDTPTTTVLFAPISARRPSPSVSTPFTSASL